MSKFTLNYQHFLWAIMSRDIHFFVVLIFIKDKIPLLKI